MAEAVEKFEDMRSKIQNFDYFGNIFRMNNDRHTKKMLQFFYKKKEIKNYWLTKIK